jgi:uncharacterized protein (TIGR03085 family)
MAPSLAQSERQSLCNLLEDRGPLAPTLCEGWTTSDLAAHLYVRESRPLASPGILIPAFAEITERAMEKAKGDLGYGGLIRKLRSGPPYPFRLIDAQMNLMEYFVHFEDVRRAEDGWEPRQDTALDTGLWPMAKRGGRLMARHLRAAGLELVAPGFGTVLARSGEPRIVVTAGPQELILLLFGRKKAARLEINGPESAGGLLDAARFGI